MEQQFQEAVQERANQALLDSAYEDRERMKEQTISDRNKQYGSDLQQQFADQQQKKQSQHDHVLKQQQYQMEKNTRTMADYDLKELHEKQEHNKMIYNEMIGYEKAREAKRKEDRAMAQIENQQIEKQLKLESDRDYDALIPINVDNGSVIKKAEKERKCRVNEEYNQNVAEKAHAKETDRQDREDSYNLLREQAYLERNAREDIAEQEKSELARSDLKEALTAQIEDKKRLVKEERARDLAFRHTAEETMAAEDEVERERDRKKKEVQDQYREDLRKQIEDNAARKKREHELEEIEDNAWYSRNERREVMKEEVEEEEEEKTKEEESELDGQEIESLAISEQYKKFY